MGNKEEAMKIRTVFQYGSFYGIGGPLGDHIIGAVDAAGHQVFLAREGTDEQTCLYSGNHHPLAAIASHHRRLRQQMAELRQCPSVLVTLPGAFRPVRMLFPHCRAA